MEPQREIESQPSYIGFWKRAVATLIDSIIWALLTVPIMIYVYGFGYFNSDEIFHGWADVLINQVAPVVVIILLWLRFGATPGKMVFHGLIVDARTLGPITKWQAIIRYLAYIPSFLVIGLGFIWIAFDDRKQGWHDKLAKTVVIRKER